MKRSYKSKDLQFSELAKFSLENNFKTKTELFREYSRLSGKRVGTVRNTYYEFCKKCSESETLCEKYLNGKKIAVSKNEPFSSKETDMLLKAVSQAKEKGKSVRSAVNELACGDLKKALRYQNKYRSEIKKTESFYKTSDKSMRLEKKIEVVKSGIDDLIERIKKPFISQVFSLQSRVSFLEEENTKLKNLLEFYNAKKHAFGQANDSKELPS